MCCTFCSSVYLSISKNTSSLSPMEVKLTFDELYFAEPFSRRRPLAVISWAELLRRLSWRCASSFCFIRPPEQQEPLSNPLWLWIRSRGKRMLAVITSFEGGSIISPWISHMNLPSAGQEAGFCLLLSNSSCFQHYLFFFGCDILSWCWVVLQLIFYIWAHHFLQTMLTMCSRQH